MRATRVHPATPTAGVRLRLGDHISRFMASASLYGMSMPYDEAALFAACLEVTRKNGIDNGYIRPLAYRGLGGGVGVNHSANPVDVTIAVWA